MRKIIITMLLILSASPALAAGTIHAVYTAVPNWPATAQQPTAVRFGPYTVDGRQLWVDASGGTPTQAEVAAYVAPPKNVIPFPVFISRFTDAEYADLLQKRATAVGSGNVTLIKQWDRGMSSGKIDLNLPEVATFKATLVSANILTQARADVIFQ